MDIIEIIRQVRKGNHDNKYIYSCCDCQFNTVYEFRKHLYECHPQEYGDIEPYFQREKPIELTKEERKAKIKQALKRKERAKKVKGKRVKVDYSKQPSAWIIYNHNGAKIK